MVHKDVALELKMVNSINFITNSLILLVFCTGFLMCIIAFVIKIANYFPEITFQGPNEIVFLEQNLLLCEENMSAIILM